MLGGKLNRVEVMGSIGAGGMAIGMVMGAGHCWYCSPTMGKTS